MRRSATSDSDQFPTQVNRYFKKANNCLTKVVALFQQASGDYILPAQYRDAEKKLRQTKSHLNDLFSEMESISSLSLSVQRGVIDKIELIAECIDDKILPSMEKENAASHQTIYEDLLSLQLLLEDISACLFGTKTPLLQKSITKPKLRHPSTPTLPSLDNAVDIDWRELLIGTLLKLPVCQKVEGRTDLIRDIPLSAIFRSDENPRLDLSSIITQLQNLGPLSSGKQPLLLLIENALAYAKGYKEPEHDLLRVQQTLRNIYKGEL